MEELREYTVVYNGHETIMNLTEEEAQRLGGQLVDESKQDTTTSTKKRTASNK